MRKEIGSFSGFDKACRPVRCSADGKYVIAADRSGAIKKFNTYNRKAMEDWKLHKKDLYGLTLANDGIGMWSAGDEGKMVKWNVTIVTPLRAIKTSFGVQNKSV